MLDTSSIAQCLELGIRYYLGLDGHGLDHAFIMHPEELLCVIHCMIVCYILCIIYLVNSI